METQQTKSKQILNLLAVGAFIWYFVKMLASLIGFWVKDMGIIMERSPTKNYWLQEFLYVGISIGLGVWFVRRVWRLATQDRLNTKKTLIFLGIGILLTQLFQFLHGFYISEWIHDTFRDQSMRYYEELATFEDRRMVNTLIYLVATIVLGILFIKWKKQA